jgi:hypothetical protein
LYAAKKPEWTSNDWVIPSDMNGTRKTSTSAEPASELRYKFESKNVEHTSGYICQAKRSTEGYNDFFATIIPGDEAPGTSYRKLVVTDEKARERK